MFCLFGFFVVDAVVDLCTFIISGTRRVVPFPRSGQCEWGGEPWLQESRCCHPRSVLLMGLSRKTFSLFLYMNCWSV